MVHNRRFQRVDREYAYQRVINCLVVKCQRIDSSKSAGKSGPGSEYCNHAGSGSSIIHKHEKNPAGVLCTNCGKKSHDAPHCFAKGGGMEGQSTKLKAEKGKGKPELAAAVSTLSVPPAPTLLAPVPEAYIGDLSCAMSEGPSTEDFAGLLSTNGSFASIWIPACHLIFLRTVTFSGHTRSLRLAQ